MPFPFEVPFDEVRANLDTYVDEVFLSLQSEFMTLPKGPGFIEYPVFEQAYEALKRATQDFRELAPETVIATVHAVPPLFLPSLIGDANLMLGAGGSGGFITSQFSEARPKHGNQYVAIFNPRLIVNRELRAVQM